MSEVEDIKKIIPKKGKELLTPDSNLRQLEMKAKKEKREIVTT